VRVPGSCGELVQGIYQGEPYLITCPIEACSEAVVSDSWQGVEGLGEKSRQALKLTLEYLGESSFLYGMRLRSQLPHGKGMASSSADIAAVCAAAAAALGRKLSPEEILRLAVAIEPTDPIFFPGLVCANQLEGRIFAQYRTFPRLWISIFDTGGRVDTVSFHDHARQVGAEMPPPVFISGSRQALEKQLAQAATKSALANEARLPKPCLRELLEMSRDYGALGINAAHSGTVLGVLWSETAGEGEIAQASGEIAARLPKLKLAGQTRLASGGIFYE